MNKITKNVNFIFPYIYGFLLFLEIINRSTLSFNGLAGKIFNISLILVLVISIFLIKHSLIEYLWLSIGIIISGLNFYVIKDLHTFFIIIMLFSFRKTSPRSIIKVTLIVTIIMLCILFLCSELNYIPNLSFYRGNLIRQSFGTQYPLVFSVYVFYICMCLSLLYGKNKKVILSALFILVLLFLNKYTNSRNDEISILLLIIVIWIMDLPAKVLYFISKIGTIVYPFLILLSVYITNFVPYTSNLYLFLDRLFSGRLGLQAGIIKLYKLSLFGNTIPQIGLGGQTQSISNYFYIDNSYMRYMYMDGLIFFIFMLVTIIYTLLKLNRNKLSIIAIFLLIICFNGITSDSFYYMNTSLLMPLFFICVPNYILDFKRREI